MSKNKIILSENSINSKDPYDIVYSNVTVVNLLLEEGATECDIHDDALTSYYVDYYLAQVNNAGFSQYVYNSNWDKSVNDRVAYGLEKINAVKNLQLFRKNIAVLDKFPKDKFDDFISGDYFGKNQARDELNDDDFFKIEEDIIALNSQWLKTRADTIILNIDKIFVALEDVVGHAIKR